MLGGNYQLSSSQDPPDSPRSYRTDRRPEYQMFGQGVFLLVDEEWKDDEYTAAEFLDVFYLRNGYYLLSNPLPALEVGKAAKRKIPGHRNPRESKRGVFSFIIIWGIAAVVIDRLAPLL